MPAFPNFGKTLVYVETNERGLEAARYAIAFAKRSGGELHAVAVINERILEELTRARVFLKEGFRSATSKKTASRYLALWNGSPGKGCGHTNSSRRRSPGSARWAGTSTPA